jgi:hypothetical protein
MSSLATKRVVATALAGAAIVSSLGAPAVWARPVTGDIPGAAGDVSGSPSVPPRPSSIAASAAEEYKDLRSPAKSQPVVEQPSSSDGFDLASAAIGAVAGTGLVIVLLATGGIARRRLPTRRHGAASA